MNTFPMLAKTFQGLEDVLRDELISIGAQNVEIGNRMVSFDGSLETMYKANLCCRTALKILKPIEKFTASDPDELHDMVRRIDWSKYMTPKTTFSIDATVNSSIFTHSRYVTYRVKDGIVDHFNDKTGTRPSIRLQGADLQIDVHISEDRVTLSLNSSGEPLSKRGYRQESTEAPLNEVLAAGIILKTGWRGETLFLDPMCGSGTFLIEAALIAANINPGIFRDSFAFEKWEDFDKELFESLYNDDSEERTPSFPIIGADIDPEAVRIANVNIRSAKLEDMISVECADFFATEDAPAGDAGIIITNPPYGERLKPEDLDLFFRRFGTTLKSVFKGYHAWVLGYRDEAFANIGLKPSVKFPINNGGLECSLREYVMFDGSYNDFKIGGGSVHNDTFNRTSKQKIRHLTDKEWEDESRKFTKERQFKRNEHRERTEERGNRDSRKGKSFDRGDRKPFNKDRKPYDKERKFDRDDRKSFDRDDRKPYNKDRKSFDRDRKPFNRDRKPGKSKRYETVLHPSKGPAISDDRETRFSDKVMRSRKTWKKKNFDEE